jgi:hypothetical protein
MTMRPLAALLTLTTLAGCGDNGNSSASSGSSGSASDGTSPTTTPTTGTPTTGTPTTTPTSTDGDSGTVSDSVGMTTTTTGEPTTTTVTATDGSSTTGAVSASSTGDTTVADTTVGTTGDTTTGLPCEPGDTQGMGDVEKSYLWVANTDQGSISKVDTLNLLEVARYRSGPGAAGESPSRTAVSFDGRFVIVNNRMTGRSTVVAANIEDCVDANNNGMIETSQNKNDLLAWGADECVRWSILHPFNGQFGGGPRGVTWSPGEFNQDTCKFEDPEVWVGYLPQQFAQAHMARLDGATGTVKETVVIPDWTVGTWTDYGPYGAALDKNLDVWFVGLRGALYRVNTKEDPATSDRWIPPNALEIYGMTVDPDGDPWFGPNCGDITTFDSMTETFIAVPGTNACHRGLAADKDGSVWVADNSECGVWQVDHKTNTLVAFHKLNPCSIPVGVSVDLEGFVWVVDEAGWAWKIDPMNVPGMQKVDIIGDHYTYSDMTGGQLKSVILPQ